MTCCDGHTATQTALSSSAETTGRLAEEELRAVSTILDDGLLNTVLVVPDMHCGGCISSIERAIIALPQVHKVRANLSSRKVSVTWDKDAGGGLAILKALDDLGFDHSQQADAEPVAKTVSNKGRQLLMSLAVAGFAAANIMLLSVSVWSGADAETAHLFHLISGLIAVPAVAYAGRPFFGSAFRALSARRLNMDVPISLAILLALGMGLAESLSGGSEAYFDACVMLLFFLLIGRYLDHMMREKARNSVDSLARLTAKGAVLVGDDGVLDYIALQDIKPGQHLRIRPGERFPVDGQIVEGVSDIDRSLVTGESESQIVRPGEHVEAGTLNLTGAVDMTATSDATNSFMAEITRMMETAENGRSAYVRIADRMASYYAPAVHLLALVTFLGWLFVTNGDWKASLYAAIAVLIITCPCALGLAVPVVHVIGANRLLKNGILLRDGSAFERLCEADVAVFDKTGTLTNGTPQLDHALYVRNEDKSTIARLAGCSSHPVARALARTYGTSSTCVLSDIKEVPGFGISACQNGKEIRLGRPSWVAELASRITPDADTATTAFAREGEPMAMFFLNDSLREGARQAIATISKSGLQTEILSGDRVAAVNRVADDLGITAVHAELTPAGKVERLQALQDQGLKTLMVGDGLNDAPALASAHVSMAPGSASEVGRMAADLVFTHASLNAVPFAHAIALHTKNLIRQNFALAIVYNCIAVPMAMAGYVTPLIAALAMSASSIVVVANSMRLNWLSPDVSVELPDRIEVINKTGTSAAIEAAPVIPNQPAIQS
ncbi:MAG: heavy metal translocating P-type ATPase [Pseudomonadota bacterium]